MLPNPTRQLLDATRLLGLTRLGLVLSAVSGGWLMTFLAFGVETPATRTPTLEHLGIAWALLASAGAALGLGVCAVALNDVLDRRQDRLLVSGREGKNKPVASGRVTAQTATAVAVGALLIAVLSAAALGPVSLRLTVFLGAVVLFYNVAGRFVPAVGVVTLGLVHGLAMAIPNPSTAFAWPVLLTMTHVMGCGLLRHHLEAKRPKLRAWDVWGVLLGWGFWSLVVLVLIGSRQSDGAAAAAAAGRWVWVGPSAVGLVFLVLARREWRRSTHDQSGEGAAAGLWWAGLLGRSGPQRFRRLSVGWLLVYDVAWLWSAGLWWQGLAIVGLLALAVLGAGGVHDSQDASGSPSKRL